MNIPDQNEDNSAAACAQRSEEYRAELAASAAARADQPKADVSWLLADLAEAAPLIPTFPGYSIGNMEAEEKALVLRDAAARGIESDKVVGVSTCKRYIITFGTAAGDLRFTPRA